MPVYFPTPYRDELLYSLVARYHRHTAGTAKWTANDLYGIRFIRTSVDLPGHVNRLAMHLPMHLGLDANALIDCHTLYPFYARYIDSANAAKARQAMASDSARNIHAHCGLLSGAISVPSRLRYCEACNAEDMVRHGELYWRRLFQVPGVLVCPQHDLMLKDSSMPYRTPSFAPVAATTENCGLDNPGATLNQFPLLRDVALSCENLLNDRGIPEALDSLVERYREALLNAGLFLGTTGNFIDQAALANRFAAFCGKEVLNLLHLDFDAGRSTYWLQKLLKRSPYRKAFHPIQHVLMTLFLAHLKHSQPPVSLPFGLGPWPCLNPAADHYLKNTISQICLEKRDQHIIGVFTCACGFSYTEIGSRASPEDGSIRTIRSFGPVWDNKLRELVKSGASLTTIATTLKSSGYKIKRQAALLGLKLPNRTSPTAEVRTVPAPVRRPSCAANDPAEYRRKWLDQMARFPDLGKCRLCALDRPLFYWLHKHDRQWLDAHIPPSPPRRGIPVDWKARDIEVLEKVRETVEELLASDNPKRITLNSIAIRTNLRSFLEVRIDRLPQTKAYLDRQLETSEQYQLRLAFFAARQLYDQGRYVVRWKIEVAASINRHRCSPLVRNAVEDLVKLYGSAGEAAERELDWQEWRGRYFKNNPA